MKCRPVIVKSPDDVGRQMTRLHAGEGVGKDEAWLQDMLFRHPELLPVDEFDESYGPAIPLGREVSTDSGPIDNLYISPRGALTVVETKLWKNPEKHRTVVAQIIDYAKDVATWDYTDLCQAVRNADLQAKREPLSPFEKVRTSQLAFSTDEFEERVTLNLRQGRFLLLIVGDRI